MARSSLIIVLGDFDRADAASLIQTIRAEYDPTFPRGVPPHITVLHPFRSPVDAETIDQIGLLCAEFPRFHASFQHLGRFPGQVLFLKPEPEELFRALTKRFVFAFPDCLPYKGTFSEPRPHVTVGQGLATTVATALEERLLLVMPCQAAVRRLTLMIEDDRGIWRAGHQWELGPLNNARLY